MKLKLIEGTAVTLVCAGCERAGTGGTHQYISASRGDLCNPSFWYQTEDTATYCDCCAAKLTEPDQTRSVNHFYSDTLGKIRSENLPYL